MVSLASGKELKEKVAGPGIAALMMGWIPPVRYLHRYCSMRPIPSLLLLMC